MAVSQAGTISATWNYTSSTEYCCFYRYQLHRFLLWQAKMFAVEKYGSNISYVFVQMFTQQQINEVTLLLLD